jgi:TetR/AcrR family transcriptional regulator
VSLRDRILETTLELLAKQGIVATSVQDIADASECAKASVLYHFSHKEQLIDEALRPALAAIAHLLEKATQLGLTSLEAQRIFTEDLVGILIEHRRAIHTVITHPYLVSTIPALEQAHILMAGLAELVSHHTTGEHERMRFGIALAGVTYALVSTELLGIGTLDETELKHSLTSALQDIVLHTNKAPSSVA